jgi:hypothetical protein
LVAVRLTVCVHDNIFYAHCQCQFTAVWDLLGVEAGFVLRSAVAPAGISLCSSFASFWGAMCLALRVPGGTDIPASGCQTDVRLVTDGAVVTTHQRSSGDNPLLCDISVRWHDCCIYPSGRSTDERTLRMA